MLWGGAADPDLDGYSNRMEFMCGGDAAHPDTGLVRTELRTEQGERFLVIRFNCRKHGDGGTVVASFAPDLVRWTSDEGIQRRVVALTEDLEAIELLVPLRNKAGFVRLTVPDSGTAQVPTANK